MGDPIKADAAAKPGGAPASQTEPQDPKATTALDAWDQKWIEIQGPADTVDWIEHFQICAIKYRYRNYDELFRCLDLVEAKVARGGKRVSHIEEARRAAPVLADWLRASAYADLGEPDIALQRAESAWNALPDNYRNATVDRDAYFLEKSERQYRNGMYRVGGVSASAGDQSSLGRNNPAGLDMSATTVAMSLAAQRSLLYQHLGDSEKAKTALEVLQVWEQISVTDGPVPFVPWSWPFKSKAQLQSLGPLFAMGEYAQTVEAYDEAAAKLTHERHSDEFYDRMSWLALPIRLMTNAMMSVVGAASKDIRQFGVAVEDVSNGLIYAQSLARLGKTKEAREMLDTLLAMPELPAMGNLYWATLYERALIALKEGKRDEAILLLKKSTEAIESVRSTIAFEAAKIGFAG
ncbi:MAG: hypothetical protein NT024_08940, partial [Proteobacteria bacterium]|nr:hypothetical protein [Pseudomonadota bacterium]